ncbi:hypothetical protein HY251_18695 [bacterium]|nr:hypothetical protein [bacterium]
MKTSEKRLSMALGALVALTGAVSIYAEEGKPPLAPIQFGSERWLLHLATDKPLYRPGETVYARGALLDAFTRAPAPWALTGQPTPVARPSFQVRGPSGAVVFQGVCPANGGVAAFAWTIPHELPGGEYKLVARFPWDGLPETEVSFDVRSYRVPRLKTELDFAKKAYGPGELVSATLKAVRAEGGIPLGASATAVATVDGAEVFRKEIALDASGSCSVSFPLPRRIQDGEGTLALVVRDGGVQETAAKTIPIVMNRVKVECYPEGGDLVQGLETRLYFEARTPKGKPADIACRIVCPQDGSTVARFRSEHEGRGRVAFTPSLAGRAYVLVLDEPAGCNDAIALPEVASTGFVLGSSEGASSAADPVRLRVASTIAGKVRVSLSVRDREVASYPIELEEKKAQDVVLTPPASADGVLRATLFDDDGIPRAERLIFRKPTRALKVELEATPSRGALRDHVSVTVRTRDSSGRLVPALVTLSAVDDAVLETIERRERAPRLPVQALLGSEVKELADSQVYLEEGKAAASKVDLLLGTQGWRRFAFQDPAAFLAANGPAAARALAVALRQENAANVPGDLAADESRRPMGKAPRRDDGRPVRALAAGKREAAPGPATSRKAKEAQAAGAPAPFAARARMKDSAKLRAAYAGDELEAELAYVEIPVVREYAHRATAPLEDGRTDFTETVYWNAGLTTNEKGEATVSFDLSDSVTTFRLRADAVSRDGSLGEGDATIEARRPFYVEPKLPLEVTAGDVIEAPLALVNGTQQQCTPEIELRLGSLLTSRGDVKTFVLGADARRRILLPLGVGMGRGDASVRVRARAGGADDDVTRTIHVEPAGFPAELSLGGQLQESCVHTIRIPEKLEPGSIVTEGIVYPSPLASLTQALTAMLREPCG